MGMGKEFESPREFELYLNNPSAQRALQRLRDVFNQYGLDLDPYLPPSDLSLPPLTILDIGCGMEGNETIFYSGPGADLLRIAAYLGLFGIGLDLPTLSETQSVPFTYLSGDITCFDWSRLSLLPPIDIVNCWNVLADNPSPHLLRTLGFPSYGRQYQTARKAALPQLLELEGHVFKG